MPVVVYLHGNSSSRIEGLKCLPELLKRGINLFVLDFAGCGMSEGEYISLGWHEKEDVKVILDFVERIPRVGRIGLWGRSMGAATSLFLNNKDDRISATVYDSPFSDFTTLCKELCKKHANLPNFLVSIALSFIRSSIVDRNGLDIYKLNPIDCAKKIKCPGFFIHAMNDELISLDHTLNIFDKYEGEKSLNICEGGHNTSRQKHILEKVGDFFKKHLYDEQERNEIDELLKKINAKTKSKSQYDLSDAKNSNSDVKNKLSPEKKVDKERKK
jgi:dipeptidyl aminopeptidase/acylaminoacyl peptidase